MSDLVEQAKVLAALSAENGLLRAEIEQLKAERKNDPPVSESAYVKKLEDEIEILTQTLQQPDQVGYWQRRCEIAEARAALEQKALVEKQPLFSEIERLETENARLRMALDDAIPLRSQSEHIASRRT